MLPVACVQIRGKALFFVSFRALMLWLKTLKHWGQLVNIVEPIKSIEKIQEMK